ncbi:MAG: hypothetical protein F6K24_30755 [Okeania sp. SIO2D1]|nr:hypothetical protein [Okeania sp. SIO2D1]
MSLWSGISDKSGFYTGSMLIFSGGKFAKKLIPKGFHIKSGSIGIIQDYSYRSTDSRSLCFTIIGVLFIYCPIVINILIKYQSFYR